MTDRVKETLFNILGARLDCPGSLPGVDVLDLFAGSGALGIEALSRGARSCLFVEHDWRAVQVLRSNVRQLGLAATCRLSSANAWTVRLAPPPSGGYGLVFVDPPYRDADDSLRVLDLLNRLAPHVAPDGLVVFRHERRTELPLAALTALQCLDQRDIGTMRLWFLSPGTPTARP